MSESSTGEKVMVRWQRANNPSTPREELERLATDPDPWVRRAVAANLSTPPEVRQRLKEEDPDPKVRDMVVQDVWPAAQPVERITFGWLGPWWTIATAVAVGVTVGAALVWWLLGELFVAWN